MGYAVELYFDPDTTERVAALTAAIHQACGGADLIRWGFQPHISLAGYETVEPATLQPILQALAAQTPPLVIKLDAVGVFPTTQGVVYLAPVVTTYLLQLHTRFYTEATAAGQHIHLYYRPGNWIPHCTVAHDLAPDQMVEAVRICLQGQVFGSGRLVEVGLIEYRPVRRVFRFPLTGE